MSAIESVLVRDDQLDSQAFYSLDVEGNCLPDVVLRENGAASFEALKAQAVAARSFTYHKVRNVGTSFLRNSQDDQVYNPGGIQSNPGGRWDRAVVSSTRAGRRRVAELRVGAERYRLFELPECGRRSAERAFLARLDRFRRVG